jgi:hypothetical protein
MRANGAVFGLARDFGPLIALLELAAIDGRTL